MLVPGSYVINRYEIIAKIGSGGMADVYKAKDHVLNRLVAIKVLKQEYSTDATFVKKFRVEAQSAAGLSHPNIVSVYDVGEDDGVYFIVMELVQGITLKNYIDMKGKLDIREALNISVQIASGLSAAHENRIIHRDIKPQNIIMSRDGKVKVTDFGIAKVADSTTVTTTAAGTVHYISPEQARGGYSDERSDIYSLGITMYEMVTGRVPFEGETNVAVALMHIQSEMVPPRKLEPSIPVSFEKIILKCTQKKPERRYASAKELIADLRKVLTHPDGEYVVIPGAVPEGRTIVMKDNDIDSLKTASLHHSLSDVTEETLNGMTEEDEEQPVQKPVQKSDSRKRPAKKSDPEEDDDFDNDEEDDDEVNPALNKVMMVLGIGGFIILAVIIFFIIGHAAGFFGGSHNKKESDTQSVSTESVSETAPASSNAEVVIVPDLFNMTETQAKAALNKLRLGVSVQKGSSDDVPEGQVYDQSPAAGVKTDVHTQVTIYISTGKETFKLDDVAGMDYDQAQSQLENDGLKVSLEFEDSDSVDKNEVIRTSPEAGSQVAEGDTVTIVASKGKETKYVTVPYVIGYDLDTAISMIKDAGLTYDGKSSDYSDSVSEGEVMNQSIGSGQSVEEGTSITLTVSLGSKVSSYTASISIENPFGAEIVDGNGNSDTYSEGQVTVVVYKPDGSSETVYDQYATEESLPGSVTTTSSSAGSGSVYAYINGIQYASYEVDFD
ncbi:Stk1 family PASTA domain-containing Ser/Thr kinase [Coprococcus catus]|uniref:Stk1 family PASTA domain-containing Ser/Thr kinase n=1 Tax=Coprococcus catus TaxID=116085 RepID=UPI001C8CCBB0|nr:Stk1 family PASTA domain-containing Ser/Thr kinase [Coprococcus catus]MBX9231449.1 Stk1 family PASTA domain-containing Ser/Thr kinase [Coprococcus catus]MCT6800602.1 Stk1 family PASTA domain-containing Ser/Thr kinase [Coprococcus catus]